MEEERKKSGGKGNQGSSNDERAKQIRQNIAVESD